MGRYLANGVMTRFRIKKSKAWYSDKNFSIEKELKNILEDISEIIDTSLYEITTKNDEYYEFSLKPEIFNQNIHELIREISALTFPNVNYFGYLKSLLEEKNIDINSKNFIKEFPFICKVEENGDYYIETNTEQIKEDYPFYSLNWLLNNNRFRDNINIKAAVILLWADENKYDSEDESKMLKIMNNMKTKYYNSFLSKAFIYYITG